jgi:hypothetical protein
LTVEGFTTLGVKIAAPIRQSSSFSGWTCVQMVWMAVWVAAKSLIPKGLAERVGFEPTLELPLNTLSKRAPSATRPSLRHFCPKRMCHALGKKEAAAIGRSTEWVCLLILWGCDGGRNSQSVISYSTRHSTRSARYGITSSGTLWHS